MGAGGGDVGEGEDGGGAGDRDDAVESAEVGGEGAVVGFWTEEELGEALSCVGRGGGEGG